MKRKFVKTFEDARQAIREHTPPGFVVQLSMDTTDHRDEGTCRQEVRYSGRVHKWADARRDFPSFEGPTPSDLFRNFLAVTLPALAPRRVAPQPGTAIARRSQSPVEIHTPAKQGRVNGRHQPLLIEVDAVEDFGD